MTVEDSIKLYLQIVQSYTAALEIVRKTLMYFPPELDDVNSEIFALLHKTKKKKREEFRDELAAYVSHRRRKAEGYASRRDGARSASFGGNDLRQESGGNDPRLGEGSHQE